MWPTQISHTAVTGRWSERGLRARLVATFGIVTLVLSASIATWLSIRSGQPASPVYGSARLTPGAIWTWDGASYTLMPAAGPGPSSNDADMAYDQSRGVVVLWDHGCTRIVMGFQGGCVAEVNRTWTWDGQGWKGFSTKSTPTPVGQGAMLYDTKLGRVVYVNGLGQVWSWTGTDWISLATPGAPSVAEQDSEATSSTFAVGYDEAHGLLMFVVSTGTWSWDGSSWTEVGHGIDVAEARPDAHLIYDRAHDQLVYVGSRSTWTWDGGRWQQHDQPAIASGTLGYAPAPATVMLVQQDSSACDHTACRTTTWTWDSKTWTQLAINNVPLLPLTRSGASALPMASDEARGVTVLFVSAS